MNKDTQSELLQYYYCIMRVDYFKKHLNDKDEFYYKRQIKNWTEYRNNRLLEDKKLSDKIFLKTFNNCLGDLMGKIVYELKQVIEWKENETDLHPNSIEVVLAGRIKPLTEIVDNIKRNYDHNPDLAHRMRKYCINGFGLMLSFTKDNLLIDVKKAPFYYLIFDVVESYCDVFDFNIEKFLPEHEGFNTRESQPKAVEKSKITLNHKYYSLLYWMELNANGKTAPMNIEGEFIKNEIEAEGRKRIGEGTGQQFYREFKDLKPYLNNTIILTQKFGKDWKQTIIQLSNNDEKIIEYIAKQYPE